MLHKFFPWLHVRLAFCFQIQLVQHQFADAHFFQKQWDFVKHIRSFHGDDRIFFHIAEERDLFAQTFIHILVGAGDDDVGRNTDGAQRGHGMLSWLGLDLTCRADGGQPGDMDEEAVLASHFIAELAQGFQKRL